MFTVSFWKDAGERALKTFVQFLIAQFLAGGLLGVNGVVDLSTLKRVGISALGAALSVVTSMISTQINDPGTASIVTTTPPANQG